VDKSDKWDVLTACQIADEPAWLQHVVGFVTAFVIPAKRQRWSEMLTRRPRRIGRDSHKLHSALDRRCCRVVTELPVAVRGEGLFYGFFDAPRVLLAEHAAVAAGCGDAIFSLVPGKLAVYFFHEGEVWLCQSLK
jgi:hypothetical protein